MRNVYPFMVEKFDSDKLRWVYIESFRNLYSAQCSVLSLISKNDGKYRILEVVDLYV